MRSRPPRPAVGPPVVRRFESTRLQAQSIALANQALIPTVARPPGPAPAALAGTPMPPRRSRARGA